ncbi:MAG TPA: formylglycine-generating enzyme family protein [Baekduia sp.]|uniref:formylglycine-generating enzyme family protein n=1 Tax=Baekduia sp. TaxID=2600305 RepID=UPI002D77B966|nr:formylglycine-generating enzyme family protein [Baekduia sp.]HET6510268.1 formylglycine-generating enzyme family protein [Baekduia sp.]
MPSTEIAAPPGMAWIPPGTFTMGCDRFYEEEAPVRAMTLAAGLFMDRHPVTVAEFRRFVDETGYVTVAERPLDAADYPDADPSALVPGSLVFRRTAGPVDLRRPGAWWAYVPGTTWRAPRGPGSGVRGLHRHPVTHVACEDAEAYAAWAGKALPTEAEWERAARGGLEGKVYAWGDEPTPGGRTMANTWQGRFPYENTLRDGYEGTSPVSAFPPNAYGLYDVCGNVWEWTADRWATGGTHPCCAPERLPGERFERRVIKGGSHLCAPSYCLRYRPAARQGETVDTSTSHLGFRCVVRP